MTVDKHRVTSPAPTLRESRGFARLWTASTASAFGSYVTVLAIQVLVVDVLAGDAVDVGLVNAARWVPYLLFGLLAGVLVDRVRRRPLLVATDLLSAVALSAIPVLSATGSLTVGWLAGVMAVFGLCTVVGDAAFQSFVPGSSPRGCSGPRTPGWTSPTPWRRRAGRRSRAVWCSCWERPSRCSSTPSATSSRPSS